MSDLSGTWTIPVSYCKKHDAGKHWSEVPDESCGCDPENDAVRGLHHVPVIAIEALESEAVVETCARAMVEAETPNGRIPSADLARAALKAVIRCLESER